MFGLIIPLLIFTSNCFYFGVTTNPICLEFMAAQGSKQHFVFQITATAPRNVKTQVIKMDGHIIYQLYEQYGSVIIESDQDYRICFQTTDDEYKTVSMDLWEDYQHAIKGLASKSEIWQVFNALSTASEKLREIATQEKFQEQRQSIHASIIIDNEDTIKRFGLLKVLVIIGITLLQIYIFKNYFKEQTHQYSSV